MIRHLCIYLSMYLYISHTSPCKVPGVRKYGGSRLLILPGKKSCATQEDMKYNSQTPTRGSMCRDREGYQVVYVEFLLVCTECATVRNKKVSTQQNCQLDHRLPLKSLAAKSTDFVICCDLVIPVKAF